MTADLRKRLRAKIDVGSSLLEGLPANPDGTEAADRIEALTAENERLNAGLYQAQEIALKAWADKTEWVQQTCQNHELGLHRADVLRYRIEALTAENERLQHENQELRSENARLRNDHASAVAELNKTKALLKGYRRAYKTARAALGDTQ